eukprot:m.158236 g.158236  ORF g.158236 m.158236 type:complete len:295 (-) comp10244_c0_seq4:4898-5782(-)
MCVPAKKSPAKPDRPIPRPFCVFWICCCVPNCFSMCLPSFSLERRLSVAVQEATLLITANGIKVCVEHGPTAQARVFLQAGLFQDFVYTPESRDSGEADEQTELKVNFAVLLDCLTIFGDAGQTTLKLCYPGYGHPLRLYLEDSGVITECDIRTLEPGRSPDIDIRATAIPCNIIMRSSWLSIVFSELDQTSSLLELHISPDRPWFRISTSGSAGTSQIDCPNDSDMVESFTCTQTLVFSYLLKTLKCSEKALSISNKISIRVNAWGFLSMQYLVLVEDQAVFIEFLCLPQEDE